MGGGGTVNPDALAICRRGILNVLIHLGMLPGDASPTKSREHARLFELPGSSAFVYATADGIFEPYHLNGQDVRAGEAAGRIHCTWDPIRPPETLYYQTDGILYGRRQPGRVHPGNCCLAVAAPCTGTII
jgi:N-alpha-acetyl-L-2,4-diaminobutyrate deacetylase